MDVKALAKSKRAHSQHHCKRPHGSHQNQKLKPSSSGGSNDAATTANKSLGKQLSEKAHRSKGSPALPSNWDRYDDEDLDAESEGLSLDSSSKTSDIILPKSKGADYCHLLAEAQSRENTSLDGVTSLDDVLSGEFNEGLSAMLAVRGEGILSWFGDDNFVVEDKTSGTHEASFLSLNLHALAENLAKVDLSKRLFIEPDLLPPELFAEGSTASSDKLPRKLKTTEPAEESILDDFAADDKIVDQFTSSGSRDRNPAASTLPSTDAIVVPGNYVECGQIHSSGQNRVLYPISEVNLSSTENPTSKLSTFEVADAEDELDMLLDSVSEIKIMDSPAFTSNSSFPASGGISALGSQILNKEPDSSKTMPITASLDDELDDLLEATSKVMEPNASLQPLEEKPVLHGTQSSSSHSRSNAKTLEELESWLDTI
ncbi:protein ECERIFERUM 16 [Prosopis cineraria]|uniref:protein ECERIFERUM 16 n=1 Tax=Prosopis cineraria TaxID=364024 RepID=UPI00240F644C|nr:protein ECERIFERUM 16 [Prosopis cineraria]